MTSGLIIEEKKLQKLIRLAPTDNVLVISTSLTPGESIELEGRIAVINTNLGLGHKLAARAIAKGEPIIKYNFPIGVAAEDIPFGAHVHVHNMRSNYIPTYVIPEA
ncbi:MAG: UxaA family hydrolase [Hyphomicrobiaceae bacterium]